MIDNDQNGEREFSFRILIPNFSENQDRKHDEKLIYVNVKM